MACKRTLPATQTCSWSVAIAVVALAAISCPRIAARAEDKLAADPAKKFDQVGPQPGDQIPDVSLRTLNDEPMSLRSISESRPTLIVTSSFTCPKSRSRWPELKELAARYEDRVQFVIVYVIEAHPTDDVCPYKGVEDVTEENRREGILRRQPRSLEARLDLAREFRSHLGVKLPIYVDTMKNTAWTALGAAPNLALLVRAGGIVEHRQGWFSAAELEPAVKKFVASLPEKNKRTGEKFQENGTRTINGKLKSLGVDERALETIFCRDDTAQAEKLLVKVPELTTYVSEYNARGQSGGCPLLTTAAKAGALKQVELLLAHGADIDGQTEHVLPALHRAVVDGKRDVVEFLIRHGADVNLVALRGGAAPLREAVFHEQPAIAELLLKAGAKEDYFTHCGMGKLEEVKKQLNVDPARAFIPDGGSRTPLCYAAANDQVEILKLLIEHGAPVADEGSAVSIYYAAERGHVRAVKELLQAGASPNSRGRYTGTPLHTSICGHHAAVARVLIDAGADLTIRNPYSETPLHCAAEQGDAEIVQAILSTKADPDPVTEKYYLPCGPPGGEPATHDTPLHLAAERFHAEAVAALIAGGANVDAENAAGMTPLAVTISPQDKFDRKRKFTAADRRRQLETVRLLLAAGASRDCVDHKGRVIHELLRKSQYKAVLKLLDHG